MVQSLRSKGILTEDNKWAYLTWDTQAQLLKANKTPPLAFGIGRDENAVERMAHLGQPGVIQFSALHPVNQETLPRTNRRQTVETRQPEVHGSHRALPFVEAVGQRNLTAGALGEPSTVATQSFTGVLVAQRSHEGT